MESWKHIGHKALYILKDRARLGPAWFEGIDPDIAVEMNKSPEMYSFRDLNQLLIPSSSISRKKLRSL